MVIPVCFKCQSPLEILSRPEDGLELVRYQCASCRQSSASFLLGYIEPEWRKSSEPEQPEEDNRRAQSFTGVEKQYKQRAKMQAILEVTAKETRLRTRSIPNSEA
jgi:hypothetical protein